MLIAYCETCGFRIPESDLASGAAIQTEENRYLCAKCSPAKKAAAPKESARQSAAPARSSPPQGMPVLNAARQSAANVRPGATSATAAGPRNSPVNKSSSTPIIVGGAAAAIGLLLVILVLGGKNKEDSTVASKTEPKTQSNSTTTQTVPAPVQSGGATPRQLPPPATPLQPPTVTASTTVENPVNAIERIRNADKELENMRVERAAKLLEEHKTWFAAHSDDPWTYKEKLNVIVTTYRSTPAAEEAAKLFAEVKLPAGDRNPESMFWHRDWEITREATPWMNENFDNRRFVLGTHPVEAGKPCILSRKLKVPADKTIYEFNVRAHDAGDFKLIVVVAGKTLINDDLGGREWRTYSLDLSALKDQEVDVSIQHHNTGWNNEHAWFQAPRFVDRPTGKIIAFSGAAPTPLPQPNATQTVANSKAWRPIFDGKSINNFIPQAMDGWKFENGAVFNLPGVKNASKVRPEIEDGEVRIRFECKGGGYMHFTARQGPEGGYAANFDRPMLAQMDGKQHELIFVLQGDDVKATLDGQPTKVEPQGKPRKGQLQFSIVDGSLRIFSIEFGELGASAAPAVTQQTAATTNPPPAAAADLKLQYEQLLADVSALAFKNAISQARAKLEAAKGDAGFAPIQGAVETNLKVLKALEDANKAMLKGAAALQDKRQFTLRKADGKEVNVGKGSSSAVTEVKDDTIVVEQDLGGGKAVSRWPLEQLTPQTRYELAKLGAAGADGEFSLAAMALVLFQNSSSDVTARTVRNHIDAAKKASAPAELVAHLQNRLEMRELEHSAELGLKKLEGLIKEKRWTEAKTFLAAYRKDFAGTLIYARATQSLEQKNNDIEGALNPIRPGLWMSFWSGDDANRYKTFHLARAETKLCWDWGDGSPDPKVPKDFFGIKWGGKLRIDKPGTYRFKCQADDVVEVFIDGQKILDNNQEKDVSLTKGDHEIKIQYFDFTVFAHVNVNWKMDGSFDWQEIPADRLWYDPRLIEKYQKD